jgi:hypothetical protein
MPRVRNFAIIKATLSVFASCPLPDGRGSAVICAQRAKLPSLDKAGWERSEPGGCSEKAPRRGPKLSLLHCFYRWPLQLSGPLPDGRGSAVIVRFRGVPPVSSFLFFLPGLY